MIRLPAPRQPYPQVWTERRVVAWRRSGQRPTVAVWTAEQLAEFSSPSPAAIRHERARRQLLGDTWNESGPVSARVDGSPMRPDYLTVRFRQLVRASDMPPMRLHDLRHGTATLALASGSDLRVVQGTLRHGSIVDTAAALGHVSGSVG
ncbi:tyrosine-type recombinase/integrase [Nonomuraea sp. NPDC048892]|uniref:tyrosine-type recombinase/integrase n=1 Tax=Nonomuraea sp. NPDC048892 TaxID=3154624 RepID=UPI0033EAA3B9